MIERTLCAVKDTIHDNKKYQQGDSNNTSISTGTETSAKKIKLLLSNKKSFNLKPTTTDTTNKFSNRNRRRQHEIRQRKRANRHLLTSSGAPTTTNSTVIDEKETESTIVKANKRKRKTKTTNVHSDRSNNKKPKNNCHSQSKKKKSKSKSQRYPYSKSFGSGARIFCDETSSVISLSSWCSIEERINLLEHFLYCDEFIMSDHSGSGMPFKRRGHQYHPRFSGQRRSNVPIDEILAVLRRGDSIGELSNLTTATADTNSSASSYISNDDIGDEVYSISTISTESNCNDEKNSEICRNVDIQSEQDFNKNNTISDTKLNMNASMSSSISSSSSIAFSDGLNNKQKQRNNNRKKNANSALPKDSDKSNVNKKKTSLNLPIDGEIEANAIAIDSPTTRENNVAEEASSNSNKPKSNKSPKRDKGEKSDRKKKKASSLSSTSKQKRQQSSSTADQNDLSTRIERASGDGAASDDKIDLFDYSEDNESAEWSKLRCTSERTEVVAERETRRHKNRCADYPGLAFGRSIFSSDTMMKFNIIRNELHNIMNTQLKRVTHLFQFCCYLKTYNR